MSAETLPAGCADMDAVTLLQKRYTGITKALHGGYADMGVTLPQKRYIGRAEKVDRSWPRVFVCAHCDRLSDTTRSHTITCSTACRVGLHRHPERLAKWTALADQVQVSIQDMLDASAAVRLLTDDQYKTIQTGECSLEDYKQDIFQAFMRRVAEALGDDLEGRA